MSLCRPAWRGGRPADPSLARALVSLGPVRSSHLTLNGKVSDHSCRISQRLRGRSLYHHHPCSFILLGLFLIFLTIRIPRSRSECIGSLRSTTSPNLHRHPLALCSLLFLFYSHPDPDPCAGARQHQWEWIRAQHEHHGCCQAGGRAAGALRRIQEGVGSKAHGASACTATAAAICFR